MPKTVTITGYRTRKEIAEILAISQRSLYTLLTSAHFEDKIPKRGGYRLNISA